MEASQYPTQTQPDQPAAPDAPAPAPAPDAPAPAPDAPAPAPMPDQPAAPTPDQPAAPAPDAPAPAPTPDAPVAVDAPATAEPSLRRQYVDWPQEGDDRAQPWDLDTLKVPAADRTLEPGAPDTVSPVVIRHSCPILTSGSSHPLIADLGRRLAVLGFESSVSRAENPLNVLDDSVLSAVERFREAYGVQEDPTPFGGTTQAARQRAASIVGPYTWEAVIRASDRVQNAEQEYAE